MAKAKAKEFRFVGRCVYGPEHDPPLTKEHILAANLGGEFTLGKASCLCCQKIINEQVEQPCLQRMFREIRYRRGTGSRRVNERPDQLPVWKPPDMEEWPPDRPIDFEQWLRQGVPYDEHPSILLLPLYNRPGILRDVDPAVSAQEPFQLWWHNEPFKSEQGHRGQLYAEIAFSDDVFCRLIAKSAHCAAVAYFGLDAFTPFLTEMILGRDLTLKRHFIGCELSIEDPIQRTHEFRTHIVKGGSLKSHILVALRLFAYLSTPFYIAVVGKAK